MGYVYKITNELNGKTYIGKTEYLNPKDRWREHLRDYKKERCEKRPLYEAMNKYGIEHFHFEVIEETDNPEEKEKYWINKLRTYIGFNDCNGYNATLGGDGKSYLNLNEEEVIKYHIEEACYLSIKTAKYFKVDIDTIKKILSKNNIVWLKSDGANRLKNYLKHGGILQVDINTKIILNIFENATEASKYMNKKHSNTIINACTGKNKNHYAYGYLWYFGDELQQRILNNEIKNITWLM